MYLHWLYTDGTHLRGILWSGTGKKGATFVGNSAEIAVSDSITSISLTNRGQNKKVDIFQKNISKSIFLENEL